MKKAHINASIVLKSKKPAFTLIEALVFLFIFSVCVVSLYQAFNAGITYVIESKKKMGAVALANEEIEKMRNLGYENLADGTTPDVQMERNGVTYWVTTAVTAIDDPEDGLAINDEDDISWDYKNIQMTVEWVPDNEKKKISMNAIVVPPVIEEDANLGYLRLHVIDQNGSGLASAHVTVTDLGDSELVYSGSVDSVGNLFLTGLDPGEHEITVTDSNDNYPVETMADTGSFDAADDHAEIDIKALTDKTIQTDIVSTLDVTLKNPFDATISNLGFDIDGGKYLGLENDTTKVYDFEDSVSSGDGTESFSDMSFGPYFFDFTDLNDGTSDYTFLWMTPVSDTENKVSLNADTTLEVEAILASEDEPSVLFTVTDTLGPDPIVGASVKLELASDPLLYSVTRVTNDFGKVYFPENASELTDAEDYNYTVTADGYSTESDSIEVSGLTIQSVSLHL